MADINDFLSNFRALSPDLNANIPIDVNTRVDTSFAADQAGFFNLKGTLDQSSPYYSSKKALVYAPIFQLNSPGSQASSSPSVAQADAQARDTLLPLLLLGGAALLAFMLISSGGKK